MTPRASSSAASSLALRSPSLQPRRQDSRGIMPDMSATFTELEYHDNESTALPRPASSNMELIASESPDSSSTEAAHQTHISENDADNIQAMTPFLKTHIPHQYNPLGNARHEADRPGDTSNTKFCYRHRPDLKCRRQANEPSMEQLQRELDTLPDSDQQGISHVWSLFSAAPSKHRNLMLQGILAQCCFPQLSFIAANVRDLIKIDFLSVLPAELGLKVLCYLDPTSICKAAQVSRRWRLLADDDVVWHRMCEQHIDRKCTKCGWGLPLLDRKRLRTEKRQIQLRASGHHDLDNGSSGDAASRDHQHQHDQLCGVSNSSSPKSGKKRVADVSKEDATASKELKRRRGSPSTEEKAIRKTQAWKDVYRDRFRIGTNWKYGRCTVQTFRGHTNGVMCVQFDENVIVSGSYDSTVKIWDIETGKEVRTLTGHTLGVRSLKFDDSKLMTASLDKTVKIWSMETGQHLRTLTGHTDGVLCVDFDKHVVASGSKDHTIRVWNFSTKAVTALRGHSEWVNCVKLDLASRTLLSASDDCTIRLWDLDTSRCLKVYTGHVAQVQQVVPMPRGFEPEFYEPVPTEEAWKWGEGSEARTPPPRYMMTGALSGNIRMWDTYTGRCIKTFFGHIEGVWGLTADTLRVVSGANDGMVKVWDPRTGACERTFTGHAGPVTCVGLSDRRMCSGSEDHEVRLYNFCA